MSTDRRLGVVVGLAPLEIVSRRVRYAGSPAAAKEALERGDVVTFAVDGAEAVRVKKKTFKGKLDFGADGYSAGGRQGIVVEVFAPPNPSASIIERVTGANCNRERDDSLEVGDEVYMDVMSDLVALNVRLVGAR
ncbi:MAG: hypothetical protein R3A79_11285 [Nannocystaceae bacterium]